MGYHTDFSGRLALSRPLTEVEKSYINKFSGTRRMKRDVNKLMEMFKGKGGHPFPKENTPEGIYGKEGEYFVGGTGHAGQDNDASVIDQNTPPGELGYDVKVDFNTRWEENQKRIAEGLCQPGLWCQWIIEDGDDEDEQFLEWDGGEKFYNYIEWLKYLINHFFTPWGVLLNGEIEWSGEEFGDKGIIKVEDNKVKIGKVSYSFDEEEED